MICLSHTGAHIFRAPLEPRLCNAGSILVCMVTNRIWVLQVITEESMFGRLAALRSLRIRSVFTMRSPEAMAERGRKTSLECMRENCDNLEEFAVHHPWVNF